MSDLNVKIHQFKDYYNSGAEQSALALFGEIARDFLQNSYRIQPRGKRSPQYLVHYTSVDALFSMLGTEGGGYLRLYDTIHSNDPTEGAFFGDHVKRWSATMFDNLPFFVLHPRPGYAYISSFVQAYKNSDADKLVYWLAYGRNGYGCSIAVPYATFSPDLPLLSVQYGRPAVEAAARRLRAVVDDLPPKFQRHLRDGRVGTAVPSQFAILGALPYFHKPHNYAYESECRIFLAPAVNDGRPKFQLRQSTDGIPTIRHYVEHESLQLRQIFYTNTVITLGPSIPKRENVRRVILDLLRRQGLAGPTVVYSRIPYRPTIV